MVLPGFTDSHIHFGYLVRKWNAVDLDNCSSLSEALRRVKQYVESAPKTMHHGLTVTAGLRISGRSSRRRRRWTRWWRTDRWH